MRTKNNRAPSNDFEINLNKSLHFLSFRPRSEKEVRDHLKLKTKNLKHKLDDKTVDLIIDKLKEHKFLDDEEFAKWWIEQRTKYRPRALRVIKMELKQKGIPDELIQDSGSKIHDEEMASKLAEKRISKYKNLTKQETYQKLGRYLMSKGFDWDTVKRVIDGVFPK
jgi:regulatory protein